MSEAFDRAVLAVKKKLDGITDRVTYLDHGEDEVSFVGTINIRDVVKATIEAMRDHPSEAMREACHGYLIGNGPPYDLEDGAELRQDCDSMIRHILDAALRD